MGFSRTWTPKVVVNSLFHENKHANSQWRHIIAPNDHFLKQQPKLAIFLHIVINVYF